MRQRQGGWVHFTRRNGNQETGGCCVEPSFRARSQLETLLDLAFLFFLLERQCDAQLQRLLVTRGWESRSKLMGSSPDALWHSCIKSKPVDWSRAFCQGRRSWPADHSGSGVSDGWWSCPKTQRGSQQEPTFQLRLFCFRRVELQNTPKNQQRGSWINRS